VGRIKACLRLIELRFGQTLRGVKRFSSVEVLFSLGVLRNGGIDLRTGFVYLVLQVLAAYLCQYGSFGHVIPSANITNAPIG